MGESFLKVYRDIQTDSRMVLNLSPTVYVNYFASSVADIHICM